MNEESGVTDEGANEQETRRVNCQSETPCSTDVTTVLYNELLMAVCTKYPSESRHQTALRYIMERESRPSETANSL